MSTSAVVHLTEVSFDEALVAHVGLLVDFWAPWCGPCQAIGPVLDDLSREYDGRVTIAKVDIDSHPGLAARFGVRSIPTLLFFREGKLVDQVIGALPPAAIRKRLDAVA